jgi:hypothetical protein
MAAQHILDCWLQYQYHSQRPITDIIASGLLLPIFQNNAIHITSYLMGGHMQGKDQQDFHDGDGSGNFWHNYLPIVISEGVP